MNTTYIIINVSELPLVHFDDVLEFSTNTLRYSLDGTKTIIKWQGSDPDFLKNLTTFDGPYIQNEILNVMQSSEWTEPEQE